jgi:hypothetical protein
MKVPFSTELWPCERTEGLSSLEGNAMRCVQCACTYLPVSSARARFSRKEVFVRVCLCLCVCVCVCAWSCLGSEKSYFKVHVS